jgi:hypothetical protein
MAVVLVPDADVSSSLIRMFKSAMGRYCRIMANSVISDVMDDRRKTRPTRSPVSTSDDERKQYVGDVQGTGGIGAAATGLHQQGNRAAALHQRLYSEGSRVFTASQEPRQDSRRTHGALCIPTVGGH